ncbi:MAG TPA: RNA polymerase sigma factor RpoD, partial [Chromatiales bacterium]|nr:RNA polymerase sigma factor RpoD [Chromatiales bacterium]
MAEPNPIPDQEPHSQLKQLIIKGKEQGFLTYSEVNDFLPDDIVDPEQIEDVISMINDMGIEVHEVAPDADALLLSASSPTPVDEAEEVAASLSTVDSELGRTTDPVRMYMREMGTVELLTREGEILIAKRIEDGLFQVLTALAHYPESNALLLREYDRFEAGEQRLTDLITGFMDAETGEVPAPAPARGARTSGESGEDEDDSDDDPLNAGPDPEKARRRFLELRELYEKCRAAAARNGAGHARTRKLREQLAEHFVQFKLVPRFTDRLVGNLRRVVEQIRAQERIIMDVCVSQARMPRKDFITSFPDNETDLKWLDKQIRVGREYSKVLERRREEILKA